MKKMMVITLFTLATLSWALAQPPSSTPYGNGGQATSPRAQTPDSRSSQQVPGPSAPVTEGCLGGSNPNYTITDAAGVTYKLNIPPNADTSRLATHVGESVDVAGNVNGSGGNRSIDVQGIGRGTGSCPASGAKGAQAPPKQ